MHQHQGSPSAELGKRLEKAFHFKGVGGDALKKGGPQWSIGD